MCARQNNGAAERVANNRVEKYFKRYLSVYVDDFGDVVSRRFPQSVPDARLRRQEKNPL